MERFIHLTVRLIRAGKRVATKKGTFFGVFVLAFLGNVYVLGQLDLLPEAPTAPESTALASTNEIIVTSTPAVAEVVELPTRIEIVKINLAVDISNPTTTNIVALDKELLAGAVRYPTSAKL